MSNRQIQPTADLAANPVRDTRRRIEKLFGSPRTEYPTERKANDLNLWCSRQLEADYAMVFFDSLVVTVRDYGLLSNKRIHLALGILDDGSKDILGVWFHEPKADHFWASVMTELCARGVLQIDLMVMEDCTALPTAYNGFSGTQVLPSIRYLVRKSVACLPTVERSRAGAQLLRCIAKSATTDTLTDILSLDFVQRSATLARYWRLHWNLVAPLIALPVATRDLVCMTSAVESVTEKLRRRGITKRNTFPSAEVAIRELLLVLRDANASWKVSPQKWTAVRMELCSLADTEQAKFA